MSAGASTGAEQRRRLAHDDRAGAEAVDDEAELRQLPCARSASRSTSSAGRSTTSGMSRIWLGTPCSASAFLMRS